ncbi:MAG TPA: stage II sporulation protein M [Candidatus Polarisedimenticolaceae bacterium]|nr:stage II sporulation protein M [Candidatus Polarisedimenticolaceae bacterium]
MTRESFVARHRAEWDELDALLAKGQTEGLPHRYRALCRHLALARQRAYGAELTEALHRLALRGHRLLYGVRRGSWRALGTFFAQDFPRVVRAERRLVAAAAAALLVPLVAVALAVALDADRVHRVLSPQQVRLVEAMYDPTSPHFARERPGDSDMEAFGFYVWNNVGIAFRTFGGGVLAGAGTLVVLVFNGVTIGAVLGYLQAIGYGRTFFPFVAGHAAFEITAIVLVGAAGLKLGLAVVAPGRLRRAEALRRGAAAALPIVYGAALMLVVAAVIEAFWSPRTGVPREVKFGVAAGLWGVVALWLTRGGRG